MADQLDIFAAARKHDLPPRWDGRPVEWSDWKPTSDVWICPQPKENCCEYCGSQRPQHHSLGRIYTEPGEVRAIRRAQLNAGRHLLDTISAFRCPDCRRDYVLTGFGADAVCWYLDPSDYEDEGSWQR